MIKKFNPTTATRRHTVLIKDDQLSSNIDSPRSLVTNINYKAGRNSGKISVRHKGGRVKRQYRIVDFKRDKFNVPGTVEEVHYDQGRSANIALIKYADGEGDIFCLQKTWRLDKLYYLEMKLHLKKVILCQFQKSHQDHSFIILS